MSAWRRGGFTLIELIVVMAIVALLVSIALPRYFSSLDRSKEVVLRQNLAVLRDAIDKYHGDLGRYPESLETLVGKRYLRSLPLDPVTQSATTWVVLPPPEETEAAGVYDVRSGASGTASDGTEYAQW